jgi:hypothetical protein
MRECLRVLGHRSPSFTREPIEQVDPNIERELLAGDAVDERLEESGEARGLEPLQTGCERAE